MTESQHRVRFCPHCTHRAQVPATVSVDKGVVILCGACGEAYDGTHLLHEIPQGVGLSFPATLAESHSVRVVVGHELPAALRSIAASLRRAEMAPVCVDEGSRVLQAFDPLMPEKPSALVLDVGIPGVLSFEVITEVRARMGDDFPIVLLASVYSPTRYKRRPNRLYGADSYLELHHVPDRLVETLRALWEKNPLPDRWQQSPEERAESIPLKDPEPAADLESCQRLVRRLLSDVALYFGDELSQGLEDGDPLVHVQEALEAARAHYQSLRPASVGDGLFDEALLHFSERLRGKTTAKSDHA
jgi:DNA-binding NarL/FixJ family response regulator